MFLGKNIFLCKTSCKQLPAFQHPYLTGTKFTFPVPQRYNSFFQTSLFEKRKCTCEVLEKWTLYLWGTDDGKPEVVYKKFCKEKYSFLKTIFIKPRGYVISTRETIFLWNIFLTEKTSRICDIYERNYNIFEESFSTEI